ncbi:MAG: 7-cyano-7-deazaguanine synthase QueC [Kiritimatiellia bacterium]
MSKSVVILLSGGLDSTTLLHYLRRLSPGLVLHALTMHYGQKHARETVCAAWQAAAAQVRAHHLVDLACLGQITAHGSTLTGRRPVPAMSEIREDQLDQPPTYVPNRNLVFLSLAAAYAEAHGIDEVFYAAQQQDFYGYWDCTKAFQEKLNSLLGLNRRAPVTVRAPFADLDKAAVLKIGVAAEVDYAHTWTCYRGGELACGVCPACVERLAAFQRVGLPDPLAYE